MDINIGIKSDPVEYRYSYEWLFKILRKCGIEYMQLGSFLELYFLPDDYFKELHELANKYDIRINSCFTTHRELGGFFAGNPHLEKVARSNYERYIEVAAILGADFVGSNPGALYRDRMNLKSEGIESYLKHMRELMHFAFDKGLKGLTIEPMSCLAEPPTLPGETSYMLGTLNEYHRKNSDTVPVYICGDISHGYADIDKKIIHDNYQLFESQIPYMCEFHFKNTDNIFNSTFGFSREECMRGIVKLEKVRNVIDNNEKKFPRADVTGYLEIGGPKLGRDYSDCKLEEQIVNSFAAIREVFDAVYV